MLRERAMPSWADRVEWFGEIDETRKALRAVKKLALVENNRLVREFNEAKRKMEAQRKVMHRVGEEVKKYEDQASQWVADGARPPLNGTMHERDWSVTYMAEGPRSRSIRVYSPWLAGSDRTAERSRTVAPDQPSSESEDEPLTKRRERIAQDERSDDSDDSDGYSRTSYDSDGEPKGPTVTPEQQAAMDKVSKEFHARRKAELDKQYPRPPGGWPVVPPPASWPGAAEWHRRRQQQQQEEEDVVEMGESSWAERDAALRKKAIPLDSCVDEVFHKLGLGPTVPTPTDALFGSDKNTFQPRNPTFNHTKRTTFDGGANVRARVRFRMEGKYPVAWLDDLHSLHPIHMRGRGDQQGAWQLPGGAPYATDTSMHEYVGGVKIWRVEDDTFRIKFYGPRPMLPGILGGEPEVFAVYAEVPLANATKWDPKTWKLLGPARHHVTFKDHVKKLFPMIMMKLLHMPQELQAQTAEDERVRAWWAKGPAVAVYTS